MSSHRDRVRLDALIWVVDKDRASAEELLSRVQELEPKLHQLAVIAEQGAGAESDASADLRIDLYFGTDIAGALDVAAAQCSNAVSRSRLHAERELLLIVHFPGGMSPGVWPSLADLENASRRHVTLGIRPWLSLDVDPEPVVSEILRLRTEEGGTPVSIRKGADAVRALREPIPPGPPKTIPPAALSPYAAVTLAALARNRELHDENSEPFWRGVLFAGWQENWLPYRSEIAQLQSHAVGLARLLAAVPHLERLRLSAESRDSAQLSPALLRAFGVRAFGFVGPEGIPAGLAARVLETLAAKRVGASNHLVTKSAAAEPDISVVRSRLSADLETALDSALGQVAGSAGLLRTSRGDIGVAAFARAATITRSSWEKVSESIRIATRDLALALSALERAELQAIRDELRIDSLALREGTLWRTHELRIDARNRLAELASIGYKAKVRADDAVAGGSRVEIALRGAADAVRDKSVDTDSDDIPEIQSQVSRQPLWLGVIARALLGPLAVAYLVGLAYNRYADAPMDAIAWRMSWQTLWFGIAFGLCALVWVVPPLRSIFRTRRMLRHLGSAICQRMEKWLPGELEKATAALKELPSILFGPASRCRLLLVQTKPSLSSKSPEETTTTVESLTSSMCELTLVGSSAAVEMLEKRAEAQVEASGGSATGLWWEWMSAEARTRGLGDDMLGDYASRVVSAGGNVQPTLARLLLERSAADLRSAPPAAIGFLNPHFDDQLPPRPRAGTESARICERMQSTFSAIPAVENSRRLDGVMVRPGPQGAQHFVDYWRSELKPGMPASLSPTTRVEACVVSARDWSVEIAIGGFPPGRVPPPATLPLGASPCASPADEPGGDEPAVVEASPSKLTMLTEPTAIEFDVRRETAPVDKSAEPPTRRCIACAAVFVGGLIVTVFGFYLPVASAWASWVVALTEESGRWKLYAEFIGGTTGVFLLVAASTYLLARWGAPASKVKGAEAPDEGIGDRALMLFGVPIADLLLTLTANVGLGWQTIANVVLAVVLLVASIVWQSPFVIALAIVVLAGSVAALGGRWKPWAVEDIRLDVETTAYRLEVVDSDSKKRGADPIVDDEVTL